MAEPPQLLSEEEALERAAIELQEAILSDRSGDVLTAICRRVLLLEKSVKGVEASTQLLCQYAELSDVLLAGDDSWLAAASAEGVIIDPRFPMEMDDGFYEIEFDSGGRPFRWTGPDEAFSFNVYVDRTAKLQGRLDLIATCDESNYTNICCFIDGVETALQKSKRDSQFSFNVPVRERLGYTQIVFLVPEVKSPASEDPDSTDMRSIGVAFSKLSLMRD